MAIFAVLTPGNVVENCIVAETLEIAQEVTLTTCVEVFSPNTCYIGYIYDPETNTFSFPIIENPVPTE